MLINTQFACAANRQVWTRPHLLFIWLQLIDLTRNSVRNLARIKAIGRVGIFIGHLSSTLLIS